MYSNNVYTRRENLQRQIKNTQAALTQLQRELEDLDNPYGQDDFPDGTILRWAMRYDTFGKLYNFGVIRARGIWYPTGLCGQQGNKGRNWNDLCRTWKTYYVTPEDIDVMTRRESLASHREPF